MKGNRVVRSSKDLPGVARAKADLKRQQVDDVESKGKKSKQHL